MTTARQRAKRVSQRYQQAKCKTLADEMDENTDRMKLQSIQMLLCLVAFLWASAALILGID
mgnify:CR=1 FL=1